MANNAQFNIVLKISQDGNLVQVEKQLRKTGQAVNDLGASQKAAGKHSDEFNYKLNQGVSATASAGRNMSKLAQTIGSGPNGLVGAYATLAANAFAVSAAFNALKSAEQAQQMLAGLEAMGARTGRTLTATAKSVQALTQYSLSAADAMKATAQASSAGISSSDMERLTKVATNASKALGRDIPDSMNRMIMAVTKMEPELVDELGLTIKMTQASEEYARQNHKTAASLTQLEKQQALLNAWASQGEAKFGDLADSVDPNPYDQLAASFSNLTNNILNFANNTGVVSFVKLLGSDTKLLTAAMIFFLNTVKGQILPVLTEAATSAQKISAARLADLKIQQDQIALIKEETLARKANELEKLKGSLTTGSPSPKKYQEWVNAVRDGEDATTKAASALRSLEISKGAAQAKLNSALASGDEEASARFEQRVKDRQTEIDAFKSYKDQSVNIYKEIEQADLQYTALSRAAETTRLEGLAQEQRALAITALEQGKFSESFAAVIASARAYGAALTNAAVETAALGTEAGIAAVELTALERAMIAMKVGAFGAVTGIKAIGVAILEWLPYVGLAVVAWDMLMGAIEYLTPESVKKKRQAFQEYSEVLTSTQQKMKALQDIENSGASLADKYTAALRNRFNTLTELTEAYDKYNKTASGADKDTTKVEQENAALTKQTQEAIILGQQAGISAGAVKYLWDAWSNGTKKAAGVDIGSITDSIFKITPLSSDAEKAMAGTFQTIENLAPETVKQFDKVQGGLANIKDEATKKQVVEEFFSTIGRASKDAASAIDEVEKSITALNNSYADFLTSIKPTTPYDKLSDSLTNVQTSIDKAISSVISGSFDGADAQKFLTQITAASSGIAKGLLGNSALEGIQQAQELDGRVKNLQASLKTINVTTTEYKNIQAQINKLKQDETKILSDVAEYAAKDIKDWDARIQKAQVENITLQGTLALAQARLSVIQRQGVITAQDVDKQIKAQNQVIQIQAQMLRAQLEFAKLDLAKKENELQTLVNKGKELEILLNITDNTRKLMLMQAQSTKLSAVYASYSDQQKKDLDEQIVQLQDSSALKRAQADNAAAQAAAEKQVTIARAATKALEDNIAAILAGQVTDAERLAEMAKASLKIVQQQYQYQKDIQDLNLSRVQAERKMQDIRSGGKTALKNELQTIKDIAATRLYDADRQLSFRRKELEIELNKAKALRNNDQANYFAEEINLLEQKRAAMRANEATQLELNILEKVYLDTQKEGLEIQQQSLQYMQKELDLVNELAKTRLTTAQINREIALKNLGLYKSEEHQQAFEIEAATQAYQLAVKEASLKKTMIDLEFALLDGQRELLKEQLSSRRDEMLSSGAYNSSDPAIKQISATIANLDKAPAGSELAKLAKEQVDANIEQLGATLKNLITRGGSSDDPLIKMVASMSGIYDTMKAREKAEEALKSTKSNPVAEAVIDSGNQQIHTIKTGVSRSNELLEEIAQNTSKTTSAAESATKAYGGTPAQMARQVADEIAKDKRVTVSEIAGYGKIGGHGAGSMHYSNRAFDLNAIGGEDAANPKAKALLDQKAIEISKTGMQVLWNGMIYEMGKTIGRIPAGDDQHRDHLHAEVDEAAYKRMSRIYSSMSEAASSGAERAANDNQEITVVGSKQKDWSSLLDRLNPINTARNGDLMDNLPSLSVKGEGTDWNSITAGIDMASKSIDTYSEKLKALGPEGEVAAAVAQGALTMTQSWTNAFKYMDSAGATTLGSISAIASAASDTLGAIQNMLTASANAKIASIDREIAAEQKRDGKSADSVAKLDALEKKKDSIARKSFNTNKKLMLAQAVMGTAAGVTMALATLPPPFSFIMAGITAAMGLAQVAIISGMQYESTYAPKAMNMPSNVSIGKRDNSVDLAKGPNANAGGEVGYLRGSQGTGSNASNYNTVGSAYGGDLMRGYGNRGFVVGEKGPEVITPETPISVTPANDVQGGQPINANISIHAIDSQGVKDVLVAQKGNIIKMLREAANASGKTFMEDVNVNVYTRPQVAKL